MASIDSAILAVLRDTLCDVDFINLIMTTSSMMCADCTMTAY